MLLRLFTSIASRQWNIIQCCGIIHLFPALSLWHRIDPLKLPMEGVCTPRSQEILQTRAFVPGSQLASLCCSHCHVWLFGNPLDYNLPRSSVHRIFQARVLELIPTSFSRGFSRPRDQTHVSSTGRQILYPEAPGKPWALYTGPHLCGQPHLRRNYWFCTYLEGRFPLPTSVMLWYEEVAYTCHYSCKENFSSPVIH